MMGASGEDTSDKRTAVSPRMEAVPSLLAHTGSGLGIVTVVVHRR